MKSNSKSTFGILFFMLLGLFSCAEDKMGAELNEEDYRVEISVSETLGDNGDPSDWELIIALPEAHELIDEYRVYYELSTKEVSSSQESLQTMKSLSDQYFTILNSENNDGFKLKSSQLSLSGDSLSFDVGYTIYVLSIGTFEDQEVLTVSSIVVPSLKAKEELDLNNYIATNVSVEDLRNNGDVSDYTVSFSKGENVDLISNYWIVATKSDVSISIDEINSLGESQIHSLESKDQNYQVQLPDNLLDSDGEAIKLETPYQFYVMSVGSFEGEEVYALSEPSEALPLVQRAETSTLVSSFRGNGSITIDENGIVYVNEFGAGSGNAGLGTSAFKITPSGEVDEFVSNLSGPVGNAIDKEGNYYLNNGNEGVSADLMKIAPDGTQTIIAELDGYPTDILIGDDNDLYVANWTMPVISKVSSDGSVTNFASDSRLTGCTGIAYDDNQNILVGNFSTGLIMSIDQAGSISEIATIPTVFEGFVIGYIDYFEGHIYATGYGSNIIYKVSLDGDIEEFAGNGARSSIDGELAKASFMTPNGIAIDKTRRILYISQNALGNPTSLRVVPLDED